MDTSDTSDTSPVDGEVGFEKCQRSQQRRNTDFSQADNDLKRFLSEREQNKRARHSMVVLKVFKFTIKFTVTNCTERPTAEAPQIIKKSSFTASEMSLFGWQATVDQ